MNAAFLITRDVSALISPLTSSRSPLRNRRRESQPPLHTVTAAASPSPSLPKDTLKYIYIKDQIFLQHFLKTRSFVSENRVLHFKDKGLFSPHFSSLLQQMNSFDASRHRVFFHHSFLQNINNGADVLFSSPLFLYFFVSSSSAALSPSKKKKNTILDFSSSLLTRF